MSAGGPVYLDHHATTPCHPEVVAAMLPYFTEVFGNAASITHPHGRKAATALEEARSAVAAFLGVKSAEVFFTSGATESNNIVLQSGRLRAGDHVIASPIEHKSVLVPLSRLVERGVEVSMLSVDEVGRVDPENVRDLMRPETRLVTVMAANGEIGTIEPISEIAELCRDRGIAFHTDATQAVGKIALSGIDVPFDLLSMSAHKIYGPKGVGALVIRRGTRVAPLIVGGGQEKGMRSGTVNVPGAIGLARAVELRQREMADESTRLTRLRDDLLEAMLQQIPETMLHGPRELRLPGNLNVSFSRVDAEALMYALRDFSLSSGSACSAADREVSHVLTAIGVSQDLATSSIRIGLGRSTSAEDLTKLLRDLSVSVSELRSIAARR